MPQAPASVPAAGTPAAAAERSIQILPGSAAPTTLQNAVRRPGESSADLSARAMAGDTQAMLELGQHHRLSGGPQARAQALQWWKRAAEAGDARAMAGYGYLISGAAGGSARHLSEARQWLQRAQAMGLARATYLLALVEKSATGPKQASRAKTLLQQAVREGDAYAMNDLGVELELGGDSAGASRLYARAAQAGVERARQNLERLQSNRKAQDSEQLQRLRTLASDGDAEALLQMAQRYHLGHGVQVDYARALAYYRQAANAGSAKAREFLALIFSRSDSSQPDRLDAAWMQQLAGRIQAAAMWSEARSGSKALNRPARIDDPLADLSSPADATRPVADLP